MIESLNFVFSGMRLGADPIIINSSKSVEVKKH